MTRKKLHTVGFAANERNSFHNTLMERINTHFERKGISRYANTKMWVKTAVMLSLYFIPYLFMVTGFGAGKGWLFFGFWFLMALGMIGIGTSVMHDANHGTYSPNRKVNRFIGSILEVIGGYSVTWKIQHNQLHHTYTNIAGLDDDLDSIKYLRFSPRQTHYWFHKYQYLYAWFIGGLNYQIEHHLFTGICHVHYPELAPIVKKTALEFGVIYHVEPTFWKALRGHVKMLKKLGRQ